MIVILIKKMSLIGYTKILCSTTLVTKFIHMKRRDNMLQFRAAKFDDLSRIMEIIKQAQCYFKKQGIDQWQNGYPNSTVIKQDIEKKESYVLTKNKKLLQSLLFHLKKSRLIIKFLMVNGKVNKSMPSCIESLLILLLKG